MALSPERISGWMLYLVMCVICYVPLARRFLRDVRAPRRESDHSAERSQNHRGLENGHDGLPSRR
jgi:hypothetical protein